MVRPGCLAPLAREQDKSGPYRLENVSLHIGRDGNIQLMKNGGCHIHQLQAGQLATAGAFVRVRVVFDDDTELCMIAIVRASVVIKGVDRIIPDGANGAPEEVAEIDDQVWCEPVHRMIHLFGFKDFCTDIYSIGVYESLKFGNEFIAQRLNLFGFDDALWLASLDI